MCCLNRTQACSHILGYISDSIGILFAIAPVYFIHHPPLMKNTYLFFHKQMPSWGFELETFHSNGLEN